RVSTDEDDAEEAEDGSIDLSSSDLELVYDPHEDAGNQIVGIRFQALDIPKGAIIKEAYIQFTADEDKNDEGSMNIYAQYDNSPVAFTTTINDISSRPKTTASVVWTPVDWDVVGDAGDAQKTPDLSTLVQEVIDRDGWTSGNNMAFIIEGTGRRVAESYKGSSTEAPQLIIEFKNTYTLSFEATNGTVTSSAPDQELFEEGQEVTLTANPTSGYEFNGWSGDITSDENPVTVLMDQNKNITANFVVEGTRNDNEEEGNDDEDTGNETEEEDPSDNDDEDDTSNPVLGVDFEKTNPFKVYPNPITDIVNLEFNASSTQQISITFYDISGKIVLTKNVRANSGSNKIEIKTSTLLPGKYAVRIMGENLYKTVNLLK
ncbi:InlB B-repeat-containing protein, partial [Flammeovirga agarivorans]